MGFYVVTKKLADGKLVYMSVRTVEIYNENPAFARRFRQERTASIGLLSGEEVLKVEDEAAFLAGAQRTFWALVCKYTGAYVTDPVCSYGYSDNPKEARLFSSKKEVESRALSTERVVEIEDVCAFLRHVLL